MRKIISGINSRLDQIRKDLNNAIFDKISNSFRDSIKIDNLTINNQKITHVEYFDGWQKDDIHLYTNIDTYDYISLSSIDDIQDLLSICESVQYL